MSACFIHTDTVKKKTLQFWHIKLIFFSLFIFNSCEQVIDTSIPYSSKKIVVNGILTHGKKMSVNISKSVYILSREIEIISLNNATAILFENGSLFDTLQNKGKGVYESSKFITTKNNYVLRVSAPDLPNVETNTHIPDTTNILNIHLNTNKGTHKTEITITFKDAINLENYYLITVYAMADKKANNINKKQLTVITKDNNIFDDEKVENGILMSDRNFDGNIKKIIAEVNTLEFRHQFGDTSYLEINQYSITKDLYLYLKSKEQQKYTINNPFVDGIKVISNVKNGLGIFAGLNQTKQTHFLSLK